MQETGRRSTLAVSSNAVMTYPSLILLIAAISLGSACGIIDAMQGESDSGSDADSLVNGNGSNGGSGSSSPEAGAGYPQETAEAFCSKLSDCNELSSSDFDACIDESHQIYDDAHTEVGISCRDAKLDAEYCFSQLSCTDFLNEVGCTEEVERIEDFCTTTAELYCYKRAECGDDYGFGEIDACITDREAIYADMKTKDGIACVEAIKKTDRCLVEQTCEGFQDEVGCLAEINAEHEACPNHDL